MHTNLLTYWYNIYYLTMIEPAMSETKPIKQRGRPPAFNHEEALDKAMHLFWEHGYEGTSVAELVKALGINKPSIYGAFGSKEELFQKAVKRYLSGSSAFVMESMKEPTAYQVAEKLLTTAADFLTSKRHPPGCMLTQSALTCSQEARPVKQDLTNYRHAYEGALERRFIQAKADQDLPADADPKALAKLIATIHQGMSIQASGGASRKDLMSIITPVLKSWPTSSIS